MLASLSNEINVDIIREIYTNVRTVDEDTLFSRTSRVRGRKIPYNRDIIHDYHEDTFEASQ